MKKLLCILALFFSLSARPVHGYSQCAMCTKTAQQMGEKPARGLNSGILYLMFAPFMIIGYIGFRWWRNEKHLKEDS